jgi:hypothetical protein
MTDRLKIPPERLERLRQAVESTIRYIEARHAAGIPDPLPPERPDCGLARHLRGEKTEGPVIYRTTFAESVARAKERIKKAH